MSSIDYSQLFYRIYPVFCHNLSAFRVVWIGIATVSRKDSLNAFHELLGSVTYGEP